MFFSSIAAAQGFETPAKYAVLIDDDTGTVLFEKSADERMTPSSMSKLMTLYVLFDRLKSGALKITDTFPVSEKAWRMQGSKSFVALGSRIAVSDLIRGIIIQSGNDACIVVAEGVAGTEEAFAGEMNKMASRLGLKGSHFANATGWPDPEHYMTVRDLATIAHHIIHDFPAYYPYFSEKDFTYDKIHQYNRNLLLTRNIGADGLKTGHTDEGGYGIVGSAVQSGRRMITVVNGLPGEKDRIDAAQSLIEYGFREFETINFFKEGETVEAAEIWYGKDKTVPLVVGKDISLTLNKYMKKDIALEVDYNGPIAAPIKKGAHIADLVIKRPGVADMAIPLYAGNDVEKQSLFGRILYSLKYRLSGGK